MKLTVALAFVFTLLTTGSIFAQETAKSATQTESGPAPEMKPHLPMIKDADKTKLELMLTKRSLIEAQAKLAQDEFKKNMDDLSAKYQQITTEFNTRVDALFADLKLDRSKYDINLETGQVIEVPPAVVAEKK